MDTLTSSRVLSMVPWLTMSKKTRKGYYLRGFPFFTLHAFHMGSKVLQFLNAILKSFLNWITHAEFYTNRLCSGQNLHQSLVEFFHFFFNPLDLRIDIGMRCRRVRESKSC